MTFSSVSRSSFEVEEVCATAAGVTGFRAGVGAVTRWRAGGAGEATGGGRIGVAISRAAAVVAGGGAVAGATSRATGRTFGSGTLCFFGVAAACVAAEPAAGFAGVPAACLSAGFSVELAASAENPSASVNAVDKTVDNAVDRNAFVRTNEVTAFLRCESIAECD